MQTDPLPTVPTAFVNPALDQFIRELPKVKLHVHLEGTVQPVTLHELAERHGVRVPEEAAAVKGSYRFRDFPHFIELWDAIKVCLRERDDTIASG